MTWNPMSQDFDPPDEAGPIELSKWEQAEADGKDTRWSIVQDPEFGTIASVTVDGVLAYTAAEGPWDDENPPQPS